MKHLSGEIHACIEECLRCQTACASTAMNHCLELGGEHLEPVHFRTMAACAEICGAAARVMMTGSKLHKPVCRACAEICEACAASCEEIGGMDDCVTACLRCAESCRTMSA